METMGVVTARILFLAFLVLTTAIVYNALYLQEQDPRGATGQTARLHGSSQIIPVEPASDATGATARTEQPTHGTSPVITDMPAPASGNGESRLVVRAVQRELAARGYDVGAVDGQLSDKTRAAISSFQKSAGLDVTGIPSDDLLRQILLGDSIAPSAATGSVPASDSIAANTATFGTVTGVQQVLAELGYAPGPIDGAWGENTARAVSAFQRDRNMAQTGTITQELLQEFERVTGRDLTKSATHP